MPRMDNDGVFLALTIALERIHRAATAHDYREARLESCDVCRQLVTLFAELEAREEDIRTSHGPAWTPIEPRSER